MLGSQHTNQTKQTPQKTKPNKKIPTPNTLKVEAFIFACCKQYLHNHYSKNTELRATVQKKKNTAGSGSKQFPRGKQKDSSPMIQDEQQ